MRKLKIFVICVILILCIPIVVQAATINVDLKTDTQNYEVTEDNNILVVTLELGDFVSLQESMPLRVYSDY